MNGKWLKRVGAIGLFLLIAWALGTQPDLLAVMCGAWVITMLGMMLFERLERRNNEVFERRKPNADSQ